MALKSAINPQSTFCFISDIVLQDRAGREVLVHTVHNWLRFYLLKVLSNEKKGLDKVVKFTVFLLHLWLRWSNLSGCFMAGRFVAGRFMNRTFRFRTFMGRTSP